VNFDQDLKTVELPHQCSMYDLDWRDRDSPVAFVIYPYENSDLHGAIVRNR
jgi:hypothetical protein